jgi:hypothetical protein
MKKRENLYFMFGQDSTKRYTYAYWHQLFCEEGKQKVLHSELEIESFNYYVEELLAQLIPERI